MTNSPLLQHINENIALIEESFKSFIGHPPKSLSTNEIVRYTGDGSDSGSYSLEFRTSIKSPNLKLHPTLTFFAVGSRSTSEFEFTEDNISGLYSKHGFYILSWVISNFRTILMDWFNLIKNDSDNNSFYGSPESLDTVISKIEKPNELLIHIGVNPDGTVLSEFKINIDTRTWTGHDSVITYTKKGNNFIIDKLEGIGMDG